MKDEHPARLLGRASIAFSRAHTEASLVVEAARFFATVADVEWVELATGSTGPGLRVRRGEDAPTPVRPFALPPLRAEDAAPRSHLPRVDSRSAELRRAHREGLRGLLVLPLRECDGASSEVIGRLVLALRRAPYGPLADVDVRDGLCAIASVALASCRTLARAGEVSRRAHVESRELRSAIDEERRRGSLEIVASSRAMRRLVFDVVPAIGAHDVTVLILGESGVGKELIARQIHARSHRSRRPMIAVNCGALPATLVDSTLFGHERGAFTGAAGRHEGLFERAHRATLFLDEVGELSTDVQAKLLRVLERGEIERIGASSPLRVDVRVVAATNRDLAAMVEARTFRLDLYHRLAVVPVVVPPLRERLEDLDVLVPALIERIARQTGARPITPTSAQMRVLRGRPWPGNVRELENVLARALLLADGAKLAIDAALSGAPSVRDEVSTFAASSRRAIELALAASGGRIHGKDGAAARLGLPPTTLQSKMRRLGFTRRTRRPRTKKRTKKAEKRTR